MTKHAFDEQLHRANFHVTNEIGQKFDDCDDREKYAQACDCFFHFDLPSLSNARVISRSRNNAELNPEVIYVFLNVKWESS
jgi:hypothetical protein